MLVEYGVTRDRINIAVPLCSDVLTPKKGSKDYLETINIKINTLSWTFESPFLLSTFFNLFIYVNFFRFNHYRLKEISTITMRTTKNQKQNEELTTTKGPFDSK